jgi:general secretion pathway protein I
MSNRTSRQSGFTLLEVMVATLIMGVAVVGLLANLHGSLRNTERIGSYDRATVFAQHKMDELIGSARLPLNLKTQGAFPEGAEQSQGGWNAAVTAWEAPPHAPAGELVLARIELEVWWLENRRRRTFSLEGFRQQVLTADESARLRAGL